MTFATTFLVATLVMPSMPLPAYDDSKVYSK